MRAGIRHLRKIAPWQRNAVAAIDGAQEPGRVRIEEMPVRIGRDFRHATHDHRRSQLQSFAGVDAILLVREETPERRLWAQQCAREEAAFEVAPGMQHVVRVHAAIGEPAFRAATHLAARRVLGLQAIAAVKHAVREMRSEIELQPCRIRLQRTVQVNGAW